MRFYNLFLNTYIRCTLILMLLLPDVTYALQDEPEEEYYPLPLRRDDDEEHADGYVPHPGYFPPELPQHHRYLTDISPYFIVTSFCPFSSGVQSPIRKIHSDKNLSLLPHTPSIASAEDPRHLESHLSFRLMDGMDTNVSRRFIREVLRRECELFSGCREAEFERFYNLRQILRAAPAAEIQLFHKEIFESGQQDSYFSQSIEARKWGHVLRTFHQLTQTSKKKSSLFSLEQKQAHEEKEHSKKVSQPYRPRKLINHFVDVFGLLLLSVMDLPTHIKIPCFMGFIGKIFLEIFTHAESDMTFFEFDSEDSLALSERKNLIRLVCQLEEVYNMMSLEKIMKLNEGLPHKEKIF